MKHVVVVILALFAGAESAGLYKGTPPHVGCFGVKYASKKDLGMKINPFKFNTCMDFCDMKGTMYAGVEIREKMCYCSNYLVEISPSFSKRSCEDRCPQGSESCGGRKKMSVYQLQETYTPTLLVRSETGIARLRGTSIEDLIKFKTEIVNKWDDIDFHYKRNEIYFIANSKIYRSKYLFLDSQYSPPDVIIEAEYNIWILYLVVDWVADHLYFTKSHNIYRSNLDGRHQILLIPAVVVTGLAGDPYERLLFFQDFYNKKQYKKLNMDTKEITSMNSGRSLTIYQIELDVHTQIIYGKCATILYKIDYNGNIKQEIKTDKTNYGIEIDFLTTGLDGEIFYSKFNDGITNLYSFVNESLTYLIGFADKNNMLRRLKFYHEFVQSETKDVACAKLKCSFQCAFTPQTYARCVCPERLEGNDLRKCLAEQDAARAEDRQENEYSSQYIIGRSVDTNSGNRDSSECNGCGDEN